MKLLSLKIDKVDTCGGLLDGLLVSFREMDQQVDLKAFDPLCLVGPNGTGKSQLLQVIAEVFQAVFQKFLPEEEQGTPNDELLFQIEYLLSCNNQTTKRVRIHRQLEGKRKPVICVETYVEDTWTLVSDPNNVAALLPSKVIGYTSGGNETLSLPFFSSRAGYAKQVRDNAKNEALRATKVKDSRLLLIDYGTNLEVLVANLLLNPEEVKTKLLETTNLKSLRSFRCIVQLNHPAAPAKGGVKLTQELEEYIEYMKRCATCFEHDKSHDVWTFDFLVNEATHKAFAYYWKQGAIELFSCFHKLSMLNDLIIPKAARDKFDKGVKDRRFAARLPEPIDEQKVFRFEKVEFVSNKTDNPVDYVSLSDGEHQLAQILGMASMASFPNVLFLLDEPESHFNPVWRVKFIQNLQMLPTENGVRSDSSQASQQECLITTHSPFVPSDMRLSNVLIFSKDKDLKKLSIRRPNIQTYGSTFDAILSECFDIDPPISEISKKEIIQLTKDGTIEEIRNSINNFGDSVEKVYLAKRLRDLIANKEG